MKKNSSIIKKEKLIVSKLSGYDVTEIKLNDSGWSSRVYIVNKGKIVFRFPRRRDTKERYKKEIAAYKLLNDFNLDVMFPKLQWQHPELNYLGYKGIVGNPLSLILSSLTDKEKITIGIQLGKFLKKLHAGKLEGLGNNKFKEDLKNLQDNFESLVSVLGKKLKTEELKKIQNFVYKKYPQKMEKIGFEETLCHGDLGFSNIIYSKKNGLGIIDFEDVSVHDKSIDFSGMTDKIILETAFKEYGASDKTKEKTALRMLIIPLMELSFFIKEKDKNNIKKIIDSIKNNIDRY